MNQSSTPFISLSATQSNANPSLYDLFGSSGQSSILIAFIGTRWLIATIGVVLNLMLVWITIRNKSLQGTCNLFIAFDALSAALYQSSNSISLYVVLSGANFIPLKLCLYLMAFAILTITLSLCATFLIGFDRLLSVLFPILSFGSNQKSKIFMGFSLACSMAYALYVLWQCWAICMTIPDTPVMCSLSDCYPKEVGQMIFRNSMILIGLSSLNYVIIWIGLKKKSANSNKGKATKSYTEKIFKSLSVITSLVLFGWMLNATARFVMPMLSLTQLQSFYISAILGCITNFALTCNAPVLYCFSKDYRKAFLNFYHGVEPSGSNAWAEKQVAGSIRRTRTENILR